MRGKSERARVFGEDGHDVVRQVVAVRRHVTVHVVLHRTSEVTDSEILPRLLPRRLEKTRKSKESKTFYFQFQNNFSMNFRNHAEQK